MAHGDYGAQGRPSWELLANEIDGLVEFRKGWQAQLNYLDRGRAGQLELAFQGLTPTRRQRQRWAAGGHPTKANQAAIARAYRTVRRRNVVRTLTRRLEASGGTRVEIHPEGQGGVQRPRQRDLGVRDINVRRWSRLIQAWAAGDWGAFADAWIEILQDLGSDWRAYEFASSVGVQV